MAAWTLAAFILIQFITIDIPKPPTATAADEISAPKEVISILKKACYDCHSNHTDWPWYSNISPVSLEVRSHVKNGREWLNFSIWNRYDEKKRQKLYGGIVESMEWQMPPADYMFMHPDARLSAKERKIVIDWAKKHLKDDGAQ